MAYYTGQCTGYQHLADVLVEKCQAHGWMWADNILSKDNFFIKIDVKINDEYIRTNGQTVGAGIILTGATAFHQNQLINSSPTSVRLGATYQLKNTSREIFPALYHLFIFEQEVYCILNFDNDKFYYLAFGQSSLFNASSGANGLWLSATACFYAYNNSKESISIYDTNGGAGGGGNPSAVAPFWNRNTWSDNWSNSVICHGLDGVLWSSGKNNAYSTFEPLIRRLPTNHFADSPLLPYNIYLERPENKLSLIAQFENARFVRIDHYEPEQIITLGHEKWKVFPFFRKSLEYRSGSTYLMEHTATFGWAIRYDG